MAFTQFNRDGHKMLSAEIVAELADLASRHGLDISPAGGQLGENEMTLKLRCRTTDTDAVEAVEKRNFGLSCRQVGLEPDDYGLVFSQNGSTYRVTGVKTSRPKYPISGACTRSGRSFKFPRSVVPAIQAARSLRDAERAKSSQLTGGSQSEEVSQFESEWA